MVLIKVVDKVPELLSVFFLRSEIVQVNMQVILKEQNLDLIKQLKGWDELSLDLYRTLALFPMDFLSKAYFKLWSFDLKSTEGTEYFGLITATLICHCFLYCLS